MISIARTFGAPDQRAGREGGREQVEGVAAGGQLAAARR